MAQVKAQRSSSAEPVRRKKVSKAVASQPVPKSFRKTAATKVRDENAIKAIEAQIRAEVERELESLRAPGAAKKLHAAFRATPRQLAAAAAAEARRKR